MSSIPKKYTHDKFVLMLVSANAFLAVLSSLIIMLRLGGGANGNYFVQYRSNIRVGAYATGGVLDVISFIVFAIVVVSIVIMLSIKAYTMRRELSYIILAFGIVLLIINMIVSNGLLRLH